MTELHSYITQLNAQYVTGKATEHSYRPLLKNLLEDLLPKLNIINEPKRQTCGAPDYILTLADLPIGFIETKDINDKDLKGEKSKNGNKEQFDRYKKSLTNLIFTDYLTFHFYRNEELLHSVTIGKVTDKGIIPLPENFDTFLTYIQNFGSFQPSGIAKAEDLVTLMAGPKHNYSPKSSKKHSTKTIQKAYKQTSPTNSPPLATYSFTTFPLKTSPICTPKPLPMGSLPHAITTPPSQPLADKKPTNSCQPPTPSSKNYSDISQEWK